MVGAIPSGWCHQPHRAQPLRRGALLARRSAPCSSRWEFLFCEAVKLDASLSDANLKKNARNTISLLKVVLFKDPSEAQVLYEEVTENFSDSEGFGFNTTFLFNKTNESGVLDGSLVGQHIFDKFLG